MYSKPAYRVEIDALRGVAVIAVIVNHIFPTLLGSGFLGVDIFFVISGYVITQSLSLKTYTSFRHYISDFYKKRFFRIFPALVVCLLFTSILTLIIIPDPILFLKTGFFASIGFSNIALYRDSVDYFAQSAALNPFTQTWSLGVEEQFYFLYPFLFWLVCRKRNTQPKKIIPILGLLVIASFATYLFAFTLNPGAAYFLSPMRFWQLLLGAVCFFACKKTDFHQTTKSSNTAIFFLAVTLSLLFFPEDLIVLSTSLVTLSTALFIYYTRDQATLSRPIKMITRSKPLLWLGKYSYSLYLFHWPIIVFFRWTVGVTITTAPIILLLTIILALTCYHCVESQLRIKPTESHTSVFVKYSPLYLLPIVPLLSVLQSNYVAKASSRIQSLLYPELSQSHKPGASLHNKDLRYCHNPASASGWTIETCLAANKKSANHIYVIGDSHATQLFPSVTQAVSSINPSITTSYLSDTGFVLTLTDPGLRARLTNSDPCTAIPVGCSKNSFARLLQYFDEHLTPNDAVVFSFVRYRLSASIKSDLPRQPSKLLEERLKEGLNEIATVTKKHGAKLILVDDIPAVCQNPEINYDHFILRLGRHDLCALPKAISLEDRMPMTSIYKTLATRYDGVFYLDIHDSLCSTTKCTVFNPQTGRLLYVDNRMHFGIESIDFISNQLKPKLSRILK